MSSSTGTVSSNSPSPEKCHGPTTAWSGAKKPKKSPSPPAAEKVVERVSSPVPSSRWMESPGTKNAVWRALSVSSSEAKLDFFPNICGSGQNRTRVPVTPFLVVPTLARTLSLTNGVKSDSGEGAAESAKTPGSPRWKDIAHVLPSLSTSTSRRSDRAFTTEAPTPWRPPEAA